MLSFTGLSNVLGSFLPPPALHFSARKKEDVGNSGQIKETRGQNQNGGGINPTIVVKKQKSIQAKIFEFGHFFQCLILSQNHLWKTF